MSNPETSQIVKEQQEEEEANAFSLINASTSDDDDFLLASSSEANRVDNPDGVLAVGACINQQSDSMELERPKKYGKCNLRKSLAWDSAFFTSAGVLDAEELTSIMEGAEAGMNEKNCLPGIQEELSKSTDSISTFESDLTLESLGAELFCDIRASIQKSSRPSTLGNCNSTKIHEVSENKRSTTRDEPYSGSKVKPKLASKKLNPGVQLPVKSLQPGSVRKQVPKPGARSKESSTLLHRPPAAAGKPSLIGAAAIKRISVGASRVTLESSSSGNSKGKGASFPKGSHPADSRITVPKSTGVPKISSGPSVLSRAAIRSSRSSCDSSSSSSEIICKSQSDSGRRKMGNVVNLPSGPKSRTPNRVAKKGKSQAPEPNLSDYLKSTSKLSPSVSPASSVSEWSTESSSSVATVDHKQIAARPCPISSRSNVDRIPQNHSSNRREHQVVRLQSTKQPSTGSAVSLSSVGSAKPSGLRMPSAKIGFFDGIKAGAKISSGALRSCSALPSNLARSTAEKCSPSGAANKIKLGNTNCAAKTTPSLSGIGTTTSEPCRSDLYLKSAVHLEDESSSLEKASSTENVIYVSDTSSKLPESVSQNSAVEKTGKVDVSEGENIVDSGSRQKGASLEEKSHSTFDQATPEDGTNVVISDGIQDPSASTSSEVSQRNRSVIIKADSGSGASSDSNLIALKKETSAEEILQSTIDQVAVAEGDGLNVVSLVECEKLLSASPSSEVGQRNRSNSIIAANLDPFQESGEASDLKIAGTHAREDVGRSVGHGVTHESQDSGHKTTDAKQTICTENQIGGQDNRMEAADNKMEMQRDTDGKIQSHCLDSNPCSTIIISCSNSSKSTQNEESAQSANMTCSLPLACLGTSPVRSPLIVKNSVSDIIETRKSSSGPAVEMLVKVEALPSLELAQKENS